MKTFMQREEGIIRNTAGDAVETKKPKEEVATNRYFPRAEALGMVQVVIHVVYTSSQSAKDIKANWAMASIPDNHEAVVAKPNKHCLCPHGAEPLKYDIICVLLLQGQGLDLRVVHSSTGVHRDKWSQVVYV